MEKIDNYMGNNILTRASFARFCKSVLEEYDAMGALSTKTQCGKDVFDVLQEDTKIFLAKRIWNAAQVARKVRRASTMRGSDFKVPGSQTDNKN